MTDYKSYDEKIEKEGGYFLDPNRDDVSFTAECAWCGALVVSEDGLYEHLYAAEGQQCWERRYGAAQEKNR